MRRRLTSTATTAMATAAPHSSTSAVWKAVRSTSIVVSPRRRLTIRIVSACSALRPNILSVARPWSRSRKRALIQRSSARRRSVMDPARLPMKPSRSTRIGPVKRSTSTVGGSSTSTTAATRKGTLMARSRAGWKTTMKVSTASRPCTARLASAPLRSRAVKAGPRTNRCSVSSRRSRLTSRPPARCARTSSAQARRPRRAARTTSAARSGATSGSSAPPRNTPATTLARTTAPSRARAAAAKPQATASASMRRAPGSRPRRRPSTDERATRRPDRRPAPGLLRARAARASRGAVGAEDHPRPFSLVALRLDDRLAPEDVADAGGVSSTNGIPIRAMTSATWSVLSARGRVEDRQVERRIGRRDQQVRVEADRTREEQQGDHRRRAMKAAKLRPARSRRHARIEGDERRRREDDRPQLRRVALGDLLRGTGPSRSPRACSAGRTPSIRIGVARSHARLQLSLGLERSGRWSRASRTWRPWSRPTSRANGRSSSSRLTLMLPSASSGTPPSDVAERHPEEQRRVPATRTRRPCPRSPASAATSPSRGTRWRPCAGS